MNAAAQALPDSKNRALETALKDIEKQHGRGAVMTLDSDSVAPVDVISTGSLKLDAALGVGGLPRGRICEIYGPEASGKTTLTLHLIAEAQRLGGRAAFIDAEHALDPSYAEAVGVNRRDLLISQPDNGEQALDITERLVRSGAVDLIVIDSVAALTPKAELEAGMDAAQMGLHARLMSKACRMLTAITQQTGATVVFINQLRFKIGVVYGNPETTTGGNALKFYSSVRLDIRRTGTLKHDDEIVGNQTRVKVVKNKVAAPFRSAEFDIVFGKGISRTAELLDLGVDHGFVTKSGAWYSLNDERLGQGKQNASQALEANPERLIQLETSIREAMNLPDYRATVAPLSEEEAAVT